MTHAELEQAKLGIANRLREVRASKGLSQAGLSKLAGFNQIVIQQAEDGMLWHPGIISGLAIALGVTPAWLQWGEEYAGIQESTK